MIRSHPCQVGVEFQSGEARRGTRGAGNSLRIDDKCGWDRSWPITLEHSSGASAMRAGPFSTEEAA